MRKNLFFVVSVVFVLMLGLSVQAVAQVKDTLGYPAIATKNATKAQVYVEFLSDLPNCFTYTFHAADPSDALPGGRDCCVRDDVVEVSVDGCYWGLIDSRGGDPGTHTWTDVGPFSVSSGNHTVSYCNTISSIGPSGWYIENDPPLSAFTGNFACGLTIDIKPGSYPNSINIKSRGVVPVAILGSATFDVTTVNVTSLRFGPSEATPAHNLTNATTYLGHYQDVNYDGFMDLVSHYRQRRTGIAAGDVQACVTALANGVAVGGCDWVRAF